MKNRFAILFALLTALAVSTPALAAPPADLGEAATSTETGDETGDDAGDSGTTGAVADVADGDTGDTGGTGGLAPADELASDEEAVQAAEDLVQAIHMGHIPLAVALALLLLVYILRRLGTLDSVPEPYTKWVVAAVSVTGYVIASLSLDGATLLPALKEGVVAGAAAVGLGEMVLARLFGRSKVDDAVVTADKAETEPKAEDAKAEESDDSKDKSE